MLTLDLTRDERNALHEFFDTFMVENSTSQTTGPAFDCMTTWGLPVPAEVLKSLSTKVYEGLIKAAE